MSRQELTGARTSRTSGSDWAPARALLEVAIVVICVGLALGPILPTYSSDLPLYAVIIGIIMGAVPVLLGGFLRWPAAFTILAAAGTYVVVGALVVYPNDRFLGFIPDATALIGVLNGVATSWKDILTLDIPLGTSEGNLILPFLVAFLGSAAVTALVVWRRSWISTIAVITVVMIVLGIAILWGPPVPSLPGILGALLAVVLTVWSAWRMGLWRPNRWLPMVAVLVLAGLTAANLSASVPSDNNRFVLRSIIIPPFDPTAQLSPLSKYRSFIKDYKDTELLTIIGLPQHGKVRIATMDEFDGVVWNVSNSSGAKGSAAFRRIGDSVPLTPLEQSGQSYQVDVVIGELTGVWVPTVGSLHTILFDSKSVQSVDFRFNDQTKTGVAIAGIDQGMRYRMTGNLSTEPSDLALGAAEPGVGSQMSLEDVPEIVRERGLQITKDAATPALAARELEKYLREGGYFSHGEQAGGTPSLSGHGADRIVALLSGDYMVGDAEQYASAMALMAREQGLTARVVMGFAPQDHDPNQPLTFTGEDVTAWVEINFTEFGWVSYFPTPDSSRTPKDVDRPHEADPQPQTNQLPPEPPPPVKPPLADAEETNVQTEQDDQAQQIDWARIGKIVAAVGIPLILIALWPSLIVFAKWRRRRRRQKGTEVQQITGGWQELIDTGLDYGKEFGPELTRRQTARVINPNDPQVTRLAEVADHAVFSLEDAQFGAGQQYWRWTAQSIEKLAEQGGRRTRLRAKLSRASLRRSRAQSRQKKSSSSQP